MFCGSCGAENVKGAKFCKECGKPLGDGGNQGAKIGPPNSNLTESSKGRATSVSPKVDMKQLINKVKAVPKYVLIGVCVAVVALIAIIYISTNVGKTINVNDYLTIEATGYDDYGTARAFIDWDAIEEKYGDKITYTSAAKSEYGELLTYTTPIDAVRDSVSVKLDETKNLSNGMTVAYTWDVDEELSKYIKGKIKYKDGDFIVSELLGVDKFDPFADVTVSFTGIAPNGSIDVEYNGYEFSYNDFSCDRFSGLRNGDTVKITINARGLSYYAENYGKTPERLVKDYTVSGLQEYADAYADLTEEFLQEVKFEAEDKIYAYTASSYSSSSSINDLQYSGYILNSIKDGSGYISSYNNLYIIYSGIVSSSEGNFSTTKVYFPVRFSNILLADGTISYENNIGILGSSSISGTWYSTKGYVNPLTCYMDIVEANRDEYTAEFGDGFEVYSNYEIIEKLEDISVDYKEKLYANAKDKIESYIVEGYREGSVASDLAIKGEYLLIAKTLDINNDFNRYIVVCSAVVSNADGDFDTTTVYFPVAYDRIVKLPGDEYVISDTQGIMGNSSLPNSWYSTRGYIDGNEMFSKLITINREDYKYEISEGLVEFGE